MEEQPPADESYDDIVILGGLLRACLVRPEYVAQLAQNTVTTRAVVALASRRPLSGNEISLAADLGLGDLHDEFRAMEYGVRQSFPECGTEIRRTSEPHLSGNEAWEVAAFEGHPSITVLAAPSTEPQIRRANTADTYKWWADLEGGIARRRILVVTSAIYRLYQGAEAIRILGLQYGASVETVGVPAAMTYGGRLPQTSGPAQYLQEIRSSIRGFRDLLLALSQR